MSELTGPASRRTRGRQIRRGLSWNAVNLLVNKGASILVRLALARLLLPEHFGMIAMIMVFLGLLKIFVDLGLKSALIQRSRDTQTALRHDTAFWFLLGASTVWTVVFIAIVTPFMVWFYDEPALTNSAIAMGMSILIAGIATVPEVQLSRRMRFRQLALAEFWSVVVASGLAITLAFAGAGPWALVAQQLANEGVRSALIWLMARWRPRWRYSFEVLRHLFGFSGYMLGSQVVHYLRSSADKLVIGYILGATALGVYSLAYLLTETLRVHIGTVVGRVMFPAFSRLKDDRSELARLYLKVVSYLCAIVFPIATTVAILSETLIGTLFGPDWSAAVVPTQMLSLASICYALAGDPSSILKGLGLARENLRIHATGTFVIGLPAVFLGAHFWGLNGAAIGICANAIASSGLFMHSISKNLQVSPFAVFRAARHGIGMSAVMAALSFALVRLV